MIGKKLGQYKILAEIGSGGMGTVYKGYQPSLNRYVAIKVLPAQFSRDKELVERFCREAKAAARLNHPRIAQIYDIGEAEGIYYFSMEFIKGKTLNVIIKEKGPLPTEAIVNISSQIAEALACAHKENLIHRDIKPGNIMVDEDGQVKVTDFGIAKAVESKGLTLTGAIIGTPEYMSPEQARGDLVDKRSDIYSLGITMYEMITGLAPFKASTPYGIIQKQINENPRAVSELISTCPKELQYIVQRAMAKNPAERYQDATELIRDLKNFQAGIFSEGTIKVVSPKRKPKIWLWPLTATIIAILSLSIAYYKFFLKKKEIISLPEVVEKKEAVKIPPKIEEPKLLDPDKEAAIRFEEAETLASQGATVKAILKFHEIAKDYPGSKWERSADEKVAELEKAVKEGEAQKEFLEAQNLERSNKLIEATQLYQGIINRYSGTRWAQKSEEEIARLKEQQVRLSEKTIIPETSPTSDESKSSSKPQIMSDIEKVVSNTMDLSQKMIGDMKKELFGPGEKTSPASDESKSESKPQFTAEVEKSIAEMKNKDPGINRLIKQGDRQKLAEYLWQKHESDMRKIAAAMKIPEETIARSFSLKMAYYLINPEK